jgi:hypothetical protein
VISPIVLPLFTTDPCSLVKISSIGIPMGIFDFRPKNFWSFLNISTKRAQALSKVTILGEREKKPD